MAHGLPGEPGADADPWSPELNAADYRETLRRAEHYDALAESHDALIEALEKYQAAHGRAEDFMIQLEFAQGAATEALRKARALAAANPASGVTVRGNSSVG